jgi:MFS family permease
MLIPGAIDITVWRRSLLTPSKHTGRIIFTIAFTNFALPFMFSGVSVTLPAMSRDLVMGGATLGLFETLYLGLATALILPAGRLADAGDKVSFFCWGVAGFSFSTLCLGLATSVPLVLAARIAQGLTVAFVGATNMAILAEAVPRERLGRAMGLNIGAVYLGLSAGPFTAGLVTTLLGWRWVYLISALFSSTAFFLAMQGLPRRWRKPVLIFDWPGMILSAGGLLLLTAGSASVGETRLGWLLIVGGISALVWFVRVEKASASPLVAVDLLREKPPLLRALTVQLLTYAGAFGTSFLFGLYMQVVWHWTPEKAGRVLMISPVLMALLAPIAGRLTDRIRPQSLAAIGVSLIMTGTLTAWLVPFTGSFALLILFLVCHGVGFAMFSTPNMTVIMSTTPRERGSMASALASQMRSLGMVSSMMLITIFLALHLGADGLVGEGAVNGLLASMRGALGLISLLALIAVFTVWRDVRPAPDPH